MARVRLDAELVRRHLARSRAHAAELIAAGRVRLDGATATKPATQLLPSQAVHVVPDEEDPGYASRGAYKLAGALDALGDGAPPLTGRRALDAGASTGGFTDVLLRRGVAGVVAVDVGYGQLIWRLQNDPRVTVLDRTNVRTLDPAAVAPAPDLVVSDLSFISLTLVLGALVAAVTPDADFLLMVKPQFEVGKGRLGSGGVVRDPALHAEAVRDVLAHAATLGLHTRAVIASPLPGPSGNVEYFVHLRAAGPDVPDPTSPAAAADRDDLIATAIAAGPAGAATGRSS
ncbi:MULTISPECIES: TlyA family RNA methyltransferase [unclassified Pseudactinotalea]|uniref:TlyA family RNA methyltransferase n=1 Tax=unclassified Pseudactinotalea TaxID=2649176 RepID=UPI00128CE735|nr:MULTISPECIES: TlyA family RNA methyltransferase [unclassified Pseudactinotalea]MPV49815.1 TlyA family RNA methyltransferase [Pseudactinotalea sp. HY160]QGH69082.1 TlyA family RNA methyltransferase [Pseudactinotalea sp. HY158]